MTAEENIKQNFKSKEDLMKLSRRGLSFVSSEMLAKSNDLEMLKYFLENVNIITYENIN